MIEYEFKFRGKEQTQVLVGAHPTAALNAAGYYGEDIPDFEWYKEIIPPVIGYAEVLLGYAESTGEPVYDTVKFYAVARIKGTNSYAVMLDLMMERQWIEADPKALKFKPGFYLDLDLKTIELDRPPIEARLIEKLHYRNFTAMSPTLTAIVSYILGQDWTDPHIKCMVVTSDNIVLAALKGEQGHNHVIGAESDLKKNWENVLTVADLSEDERAMADHLFEQKVRHV